MGKTTVANRLVQSGLCTRVVTTTSRACTDQEEEGVDYHFITSPDFKKKLDEGYFLEYALVFDQYYGTPLNSIQQCLEQGKIALLLIDVQGARQVRQTELPALFVFLAPPDEETLMKRLLNRERDSKEAIARRLAEAKKELAAKDEYDHIVINQELDRAVQEIERLIQNRDKGTCGGSVNGH